MSTNTRLVDATANHVCEVLADAWLYPHLDENRC